MPLWDWDVGPDTLGLSRVSQLLITWHKKGSGSLPFYVRLRPGFTRFAGFLGFMALWGL